MTADILNRQLRARSASIKILARKKSPGAKPGGSRQEPVHSGIGDLTACLAFGNVAERQCAFVSPSVLQSPFHPVESQAFDKSSVDRCIGTMSARIGIRLSARTMAGAHITDARPPIKMRLRVSIETT